MKAFARWTLCFGLCLALLVCGALADEAPSVTVQLDGQALTFTDAVPQVKDQRAFLPFRAVFEAMGAQVDYEGSVITAVRDGKALAMTLDQTAATVTENGVTTTITMDVAPYVDPATWRAYVPVRFAAQAFGCVVGWDQDAQTAIIVDTEKLVSAAIEGKDFTYLEGLAALSGKYDAGIWDMTATFDADVSVMTIPMLTMTGEVKGTVQDGDKMSVDMDMKMDMSGATAMMGSLTAEKKAAMDALKAHGVDMIMRGDLATGKLYANMDMGPLNAQAEVDPAAWYELDMAALMEQLGMDRASVLTTGKEADMLSTLTALFSGYQPDNAATARADVKAMVEEAVNAFSDEGFALADGQRVTSYTLEQGDTVITVVLVLDVDRQGVKGYSIGLDMVTVAGEQAAETSMTIGMDGQNSMNAEMTMNMGLVSMTMTMEGTYAPGTTAPVTAPPAGATTIPFTDLMGGQAGLGVIGGADGPTAILVG